MGEGRDTASLVRAAAAWAVGMGLMYAAFELGRSLAGYSLVTAFEERRKLSEQVAALRQETQELERKLAAAEVTRRIDQEAQAETQANIGELQAELARQQQELEFYRGLVAEKFGASTLKVQEVAIEAGSEPGRFTARITLVQTASRNTVTRGQLQLAVEGTRGGALARLPMEEVTPDGRKNTPFSLRFFRTLEIELSLPEGFEPASLALELRSDRTGSEPIIQSFPWNPALGAPGEAALTPGVAGE